MSPQLRELLAAMNAVDRNVGLGRHHDHAIHPYAQAMELRDRFRRAVIINHLEPGMLCHEKRGLGSLKLPDAVVMFWRWLDPKDVQDAQVIAREVANSGSSRTDCLIGLLTDEGTLALGPTESWRLEPCDAEFPENGEAPA